MSLYIVTVKLAKNPEHNPREKVTSSCALSECCTDSTGEHHSMLVEAPSEEWAWAQARVAWGHVTRVEAAHVVRQFGFAEEES